MGKAGVTVVQPKNGAKGNGSRDFLHRFLAFPALFDIACGSGEEADVLSSVGVPLPVGMVAEGGRSAIDKGEGISGERREKERENPKKI